MDVVDVREELDVVLDIFSSSGSFSFVRSVILSSHIAETWLETLRLLLPFEGVEAGCVPDEVPDDVLDLLDLLDVLDVLGVLSLPVELEPGGVPDELPDGPTGVVSGLAKLKVSSSCETGLKYVNILLILILLVKC